MDLPYATSLKHTVYSHGWVNLAPWIWDDVKQELSRKECLNEACAVNVVVTQTLKNRFLLEVHDHKLSPREESTLQRKVTRWLSGDWDPRPVIQLASSLDSCISKFVREGGGRLLRGSTFFEDFSKTILTINTNWASTKRMSLALTSTTNDGTFPTPAKILTKGEDFLRSNLKLGFRSKVLYQDTELLLNKGIVDEEGNLARSVITYEELIALHGIGPYAASHIMVLEHDFSRIPVDSEVTSYFSKRADPNGKEIPELFQHWGEYAYLGYKLGRLVT